MADFAYKRYRMIRGKLALEAPDAEDVCKLTADGFLFADIAKYIPAVTQERYEEFLADLMFQARLEFLKATKDKDEDETYVPKTPEELIEYGIRRLWKLSKSGKAEQRVQVDASKQLVAVGMELKGTGTKAPLPSIDTSKKDYLKTIMGAA